MIIAIDGPAGSGKSTIAKILADRLNLLYLDTGAMYRAVTLAFKKAKEASSDEDLEIIGSLLPSLSIKLEANKVLLNGEDVSHLIRSSEISNNVSHVAAFKLVRDKLVEEQRNIANNCPKEFKGTILDGRDIGTVVFPNADLKIFLTASVEVRARRRLKDLESLGEKVDLNLLINEVAARDEKDSKRSEGPLKQADDAIEINTDDLTIEEVVEKIHSLI